MDHRPPLQRSPPQSTLQSTAQSALVTASVLLLLTWVGGWLFHLHQPMMLATSLLIVILALSMVGLRLARGNSPRQPMTAASRTEPTTRSGRPAAGSNIGTREGTTAPVRGKRWSLDVFTNIDAPQFAAVCETWFSWAGFDTRRECHRTMHGVDIWLHASRRPGHVAIVRCQHAPGRQVGLQELREFQCIVATSKNAHGTFTTTSSYTPEALQFAEENGIEVMDGHDLLRRILTRTRRSQQALLAVAYHGR